MAKPLESPSGRMPQVDVLRGVAILLVLGSHPAVKFNHAGPFLPLADCWHRVGYSGVDLFFVLSGFLIGGLLFSEIRKDGRIDVRRFLIRRAFKIWPSYYFYLLIMALLLLHVRGSAAELTPYFLHLQNYMGLADVGWHTWSLAIEEHFYLVLPLVLLAAAPFLRYPLLVPAAWAMLVVSCTILRGYSGLGMPAGLTHLRIDSLGFGVLLAFTFHYHRPWFDYIARFRLLLVPAGLALVYLATDREWLAPRALMWVPAMLFLGYGAILVSIVSTPAEWYQGRAAKVLILVGLYSYTIYLWHIDGAYKIIYLLSQETDWVEVLPSWSRWPVGTLAYVLLATGVGILMSRFIEQPALALRDYLFPSKSRALEPVGGEAEPVVESPGVVGRSPAVSTMTWHIVPPPAPGPAAPQHSE